MSLLINYPMCHFKHFDNQPRCQNGYHLHVEINKSPKQFFIHLCHLPKLCGVYVSNKLILTLSGLNMHAVKFI